MYRLVLPSLISLITASICVGLAVMVSLVLFIVPGVILGLWFALTTLREKLVKIGAKVVTHSRYVIFQLAEVAVPRQLLAGIPWKIQQLAPAPT